MELLFCLELGFFCMILFVEYADDRVLCLFCIRSFLLMSIVGSIFVNDNVFSIYLCWVFALGSLVI